MPKLLHVPLRISDDIQIPQGGIQFMTARRFTAQRLSLSSFSRLGYDWSNAERDVKRQLTTFIIIIKILRELLNFQAETLSKLFCPFLKRDLLQPERIYP